MNEPHQHTPLNFEFFRLKMDWATQTDDLSVHIAQSQDDAIDNVMIERFHIQRPTSFIGPQVLVTLATVETGLSNQYAKQSEQNMTGDTTNTLPPHVIQLASDAFLQMVAKQQDQTIFIWGEQSSGKSTARMAISRQLVDIARNGKKKSKVLSGATKIETCLNSFGCYQTSTQSFASGYGRFTEYQYSKSGRMIGLKLLEYGLQKSRVTNALSLPDGHRTFNVFYEMLASASVEERTEWGLTDLTGFAFTKGSHPAVSLARSNTIGRLTLGRSKSLSRKQSIGHKQAHVDAAPTAQDTRAGATLRENLKSLGIGRRTQTQIFKLLSAILHLGNIVFVDNAEKEGEACEIKNVEALDKAAQLLYLSSEKLQNTMLYKSKVVGKDTFSIFLKAEQAAQHRDTLAQTLYSLLFTWIVEHINTRLCKPESEVEGFIGVCDFPFFQGCPKGRFSAGFETLLANYALERLTNYCQYSLFDEPDQTFGNQGLKINAVDYVDNQISVDLFDGTHRVSGIWSLFDKSSTLEIPADSTFGHELVAYMDKELKANAHYITSGSCNTMETSAKGVPKPLFGVRHYTGKYTVDYDVDSFFEEGAVLSDFVALFRGNATTLDAADTQTTFVANLFSLQNGLQVVKSKI
jgi:chitin synthase